MNKFQKDMVEKLNNFSNKQMKTYKLKGSAIESKYKGCGHGIIVVEKATNSPVDMHYENIGRSGKGGEIFAENETTISYIVNFSCYEACLF